MTISRRRGTVLVSTLALAATLGLAGCSAGVNGAAGGASSSPMMAPDAMLQESAAFDAVATDRSIIVTGWATILVDDPQAAASAATAIVEDAGGRIDAQSVQAPTEYSGGSASLTLRVPASSLQDVLAELGELGRVQTVSTNASDVTIEVQDLDARIGALRSSIERLEELQAQSSSIDALIQLETAISDRQAQLESLEAQQRYYADQVTMSTLTLELVSQPVVAEPDPGSFWDGVVKGWEALGAFASGLVIALGVLLPWLIPIAVIGAIVWIVIATSRARKRKASSASVPPSEPPISG